MKRSIRTLVSITVAGGAALAGAAPVLAETRGSGASFPRVAYQTWCQESGLCSYTSKGSTGGINDFTNGVVDFGASDAPLTDAQLATLASRRGGVTPVYFPTLLGAVTVPTNIEGQPGPLRLSAATVGKIFAGTITRWDDPVIKAENAQNTKIKGWRFPAQPITRCVRADGSGTSFAFTVALAKGSTVFRSRLAPSQLPAWPAGSPILRGQGNPGVAACVSQTSGAIGYVDLADAGAAGLGPKIAAIGKVEKVRIKRRVNGRTRFVTVRQMVYVRPTVTSMARAGQIAAGRLPANLLVDMTMSGISSAYPITTTTWVLAYSDFGAAGKSSSLAGTKAVLEYYYSAKAQARLANLGFAPLPPQLLDAAKAQLARLK